MSKTLNKYLEEETKRNKHLTKENFYRIMLLFSGISYNRRDSFPDNFSRIEIIFTAKALSSVPLLTFLKPNSPFALIDGGTERQKVLLYKGEFVDEILDYDETTFDLMREEPFYFFVKEVNGDVVLKLNPIQLCDFFKNSYGNLPCSFCFRNDMVLRFKNITTDKLIRTIYINEKKDDFQKLAFVDEVSIITGSYKNDGEYLNEMTELVKKIKKLVPEFARITVGSHEAKSKNTFLELKKAGVTDYTFPVESFSDEIRMKAMRNRKGKIKIDSLLSDIKECIDIFGNDHTIVRSVAGMGDELDLKFTKTIETISSFGKDSGPLWNVNVYMPFTHYHWRLFQKNPGFDQNYLFRYISTINEFVPQERFIRFKISP